MDTYQTGREPPCDLYRILLQEGTLQYLIAVVDLTKGNMDKLLVTGERDGRYLQKLGQKAKTVASVSELKPFLRLHSVGGQQTEEKKKKKENKRQRTHQYRSVGEG